LAVIRLHLRQLHAEIVGQVKEAGQFVIMEQQALQLGLGRVRITMG